MKASLHSLWWSVPSVTRAGLLLGAAGVVADVVHHVFIAGALASIGFIGHVLTLVGMVLALSGVVNAALGSHRRAREKGGNDAARSGATAAR